MRWKFLSRRRRRAPSALAVAAVVLLGSALVACGDDGEETTSDAAPQASEPNSAPEVDQALIDAATEEGTVVWYTSSNEEIAGPAADAFTDRYGIEVELIRLVSAELGQRFLAEADAGSTYADIITVSDLPFIDEALSRDYLTPLQDLGIPGFPEEYPEDFIVEEYGTAVFSVGLTGLAYNTSRVAEDEAPTTWEELADPRWEGELLLSDPTSSSAYLSFFDALLSEYGEDYLRALGENTGTVYPSQVPNVNALGANEGSVSVFTLCSTVCSLAEEGAPIEQVQPTDRAMGVEFLLNAAAEAPHPNAAKLFAHFMLFDEGQQIINSEDESRLGPYVQAEALADYEPPRPDFLDRRDQILSLLGAG